MSDQYQELDQRIIAAIQAGSNPLYNRHANNEAIRLAKASGREEFRVIDGRLQAMRKAGKIRHLTKAEGNGTAGWRVVDQ